MWVRIKLWKDCDPSFLIHWLLPKTDPFNWYWIYEDDVPIAKFRYKKDATKFEDKLREHNWHNN